MENSQPLHIVKKTEGGRERGREGERKREREERGEREKAFSGENSTGVVENTLIKRSWV